MPIAIELPVQLHSTKQLKQLPRRSLDQSKAFTASSDSKRLTKTWRLLPSKIEDRHCHNEPWENSRPTDPRLPGSYFESLSSQGENGHWPEIDSWPFEALLCYTLVTFLHSCIFPTNCLTTDTQSFHSTILEFSALISSLTKPSLSRLVSSGGKQLPWLPLLQKTYEVIKSQLHAKFQHHGSPTNMLTVLKLPIGALTGPDPPTIQSSGQLEGWCQASRIRHSKSRTKTLGSGIVILIVTTNFHLDLRFFSFC